MPTCPNCTTGEQHHPEHDVSFIHDGGMTTWCACPCTTTIETTTPAIDKGELVRLIAGRYANKTGFIRAITTNESTYAVYLPALDREQYVPREWVERIETP